MKLPFHYSLFGEAYMQKQAENECPVTLGSHVSWFPKSERWLIEVTVPQTMQAVWISHDALCRITEVDTRDPAVISGLVQIHRSEIEQHIRRAEMENWKDALGVLPKGQDGFYQR